MAVSPAVLIAGSLLMDFIRSPGEVLRVRGKGLMKGKDPGECRFHCYPGCRSDRGDNRAVVSGRQALPAAGAARGSRPALRGNSAGSQLAWACFERYFPCALPGEDCTLPERHLAGRARSLPVRYRV